MKDNKKNNEFRFYISLGFLSTILVFLSFRNNFLYSAIDYVLILTSFLFFAYILCLSSFYKYKNPGEIYLIGGIQDSYYKFFDLALNIYGFFAPGILMLLIFSQTTFITFFKEKTNRIEALSDLLIVVFLSSAFILLIEVFLRIMLIAKYKKFFWKKDDYKKIK